MNEELLRTLKVCETDVEGALKRFSEEEELYKSYLELFLCDTTVEDLDAAIESRSWDDAFTAVHALKGLAGNLGFIPLYQATAELVMLIRAGRLEEIEASKVKVEQCHREIVDAIKAGLKAN